VCVKVARREARPDLNSKLDCRLVCGWTDENFLADDIRRHQAGNICRWQYVHFGPSLEIKNP